MRAGSPWAHVTDVERSPGERYVCKIVQRVFGGGSAMDAQACTGQAAAPWLPSGMGMKSLDSLPEAALVQCVLGSSWCTTCGESVQAVPGGWRNRCHRWSSGSSDLNLIEDLLDVTRLPLRLSWSRRTSPRTPFIVLGACAAIFRQAYKTSTWTNCWVPFGVAAVASLMHHHFDFQSCAGPFIPNAESISVLIDVFSVCSLIFWAVHIFVLAKLNH